MLLPILLLFAAEIPSSKPVVGPIEKEHKMVVQAVRGCPEPREGEVVVCSRDRGVAEGYRLPRLDPRFADNLRPTGRAGPADATLGASGAGACSPSGAGGFTGCAKRGYDAGGAARRRRKAEARAYETPR